MSSSHQEKLEPEANSQERPKALVLGGGAPALVAAESLCALGAEVTYCRIRSVPSHNYFTPSGAAAADESPVPSEAGLDFEILDSDAPPSIRRDAAMFRASFEGGTEKAYDCLVLAPGISLRPAPVSMPAGVRLYDSGFTPSAAGRVTFIMDYGRPSDPALGMNAIHHATRNVIQGGESHICFKNLPALNSVGERICDAARKAGVRFLRFGDAAPVVARTAVDNGPDSFRVVVRDVIDLDEETCFECDEVLVVTSADPSSIPQWARDIAAHEIDTEGFMSTDSVHSHSGGAFAGGIFLVGEALGDLDPIRGATHARAAAAGAFAWMKESRRRADDQAIVVETACVGCLTCRRVCPHEAVAVRLDLFPHVKPSPFLCRECGICASLCPTAAIRLKASPEQGMLSFIRSVPLEEIARTTFVFGCRRSAARAAETIQIPEAIRFMEVPCAGRVSEYVMWSALESGAKGVLVVGCRHGNCASRSGTDWAAARIRRSMRAGLSELEAPFLAHGAIAANEALRFERMLREFDALTAPSHGEPKKG